MDVPVTGISSRYFSRTSSDPHRSRFKLHTAVLSVLCVMFQVQLSFVVNLTNVFPVQFPDFSLSSSLLIQWLQLLLVQSYMSGSTFAVSLYTNCCILTSFPLPFTHFSLRVLPHLSVCMFSIIVSCLFAVTSLCVLIITLLLLLLLLLYDMDVSCHRSFLPGTSLELAVIPTAQASSSTLQYFPYYV